MARHPGLQDTLADMSAIMKLVSSYFDALYDGDAEKFAAIFHPAARLFCATDEQPIIMDLPQYVALVRGRASPAASHLRREDECLSVELASPTTAHVRTRELFVPKRFTDELTVVLTEGEWRIVSKVWHYVLEVEHA